MNWNEHHRDAILNENIQITKNEVLFSEKIVLISLSNILIMKLLQILFFFQAFLFSGCVHSHEKVFYRLNDSIQCEQQPEQFYCVYLPDTVSTGKKYPVLFLFDPSARAKKAVEQYSTLADKYNIILACSYNSKNGPVEDNTLAAHAMISDALEKFPVDENLILYSGFSGGSRFAYYYAQNFRKAKGLIATGAFYPVGNKPFSVPDWIYSGVVGNADFNFTEGLNMANTLWRSGYPFQFITTDEEHGWPSDTAFERALCYQLSQITGNKFLESEYIELEEEALEKSKSVSEFINSLWILQNLSFIDRNYTTEMQNLSNEKSFTLQLKEFEKSIRLEDSLKIEFGNAVRGILMQTNNQTDGFKSLKWWEGTINKLNEISTSDNSIYLQHAANRARAHIGILLWEINRKLVKEKFYNKSLEAAEILILAYPENDTYYAIKAESLYVLGNKTEAMKNIARALELGYTKDNEYLKNNQILKKISEELE
ncbi:MAG: hypothetical protein JXA77_07865 [Bacteroidales bacterium]|nr:hypothetical protein [Bacteroidales bacterium]MBN2819518.1 hypothetical protein [Bacteroidales bacterium]